MSGSPFSSTMLARGPRETKRMRSEILSSIGVENGSSSSSAKVLPDLTLADEDILQCHVCFLPLKPPIFQCPVGHILCSRCSDKLKGAHGGLVSCHICRVVLPDGYQRCHAMERVVDSVIVPCPHVRYGCDARPAYHARDEHLLQCPHTPRHCPGRACGFLGPVPTLVEHLAAAHGWACTAESRAGGCFSIFLRDGFNFLTTVRGSHQHLLLLNMARTVFGRAISAVWMCPRPSTRDTTCHLELTFFMESKHDPRVKHYQTSRFQVERRCPASNGLPDPSTSYQFVIPKCVRGSDDTSVHVTACCDFHQSVIAK